MLAAFRALRRDQLETILLTNDALTPASRRVVAHRILGQLRERGLVQAAALPGVVGAGRGRAFVLTPAGQRLYAASDPLYPRRRIRRATSTLLLEHAIALADIAIAFREAVVQASDIALEWESDWEAVARLGSVTVLPDAFVTLERRGWRTRAFVEADRSTEWEGAFAKKVRGYIDLYRSDDWRVGVRSWPLILTVTTSDPHARSLCRLADRVTRTEGGARIAHAFRFTSFEQLRSTGALAPIWHVPTRIDRAAILEFAESDQQRTAGVADSRAATTEATA